MFDIHQATIERYAKANAENWFKTIQFVLLTIQQPLWQIPNQMELVNRQGAEANCLWGMKGVGWAWHKEHMHETYDHAMLINHIHPNPEHAASELLLYLAGLPSLGLVKAGFVAQLAFGLVGCLDTHNLFRFGLSESEFKSSSFKGAKTITTKQRKVNHYIAVCNDLGGARGLWNSWCAYVYERNAYALRYDSAFAVSAMHCEALGL